MDMDFQPCTVADTDRHEQNGEQKAHQNPPRNVKSTGFQRNRTQLSCTNCRHSKLKCDRKTPCSQCTKRGKDSQCTFPTPVARRKPVVSMQSRLRHLESLVKNAMTAQTSIAEGTHIVPQDQSHSLSGSGLWSLPAASDPKNSNPSDINPGHVVQGATGATFVGATHWAAIFEDIEEIHNYFEEAEDESDDVQPYTTLSFHAKSPATKNQLLAVLPERPVVDRLVSTYFNSNSPGLQIIHKSTFQNQYQKFWANLEGTPVAWLGLLFSILVLSSVSSLRSTDAESRNDIDPVDVIRKYRDSCVQCLLLSNYTKPGLHTIETLLIFMEGEFLLSKDDQVHCFLLVGNTVRLAMRMGLHRDSSKVGRKITPFQAEMRRRIWHHLVNLDILSSIHIGLPGMTHSLESDTRYPSNLRDEDFNEDSLTLLAPRPDSELTPMTYTIYKSKLCRVAAKVSVVANRLASPSYDEIMMLDQELQAIHSEVPQFFQLGSQNLITDSSERVVKRFSLTLLYEKSRCLLHRSFMLREKRHPEYAYSRTVGLEAAMELLRCQSMVYEAALPGGTLSQDRWFLSSLSMHDFLLAAMMVYMSMMQWYEDGVSSEDAKMKEMAACINKSYTIWTLHWINSFEAKKAASILAGMIRKVSLVAEKSTVSALSVPGVRIRANLLSDLTIGDHLLPSDPVQPSQTFTANWAPSDSTLSSGIVGDPFDINILNNDVLPVEGLIDIPPNFDWELFDNEVRPAQAVTENWPNFAEDFLNESTKYF